VAGHLLRQARIGANGESPYRQQKHAIHDVEWRIVRFRQPVEGFVSHAPKLQTLKQDVHRTTRSRQPVARRTLDSRLAPSPAVLTPPHLAGRPGWVYATLGVVMPVYGKLMDRRRPVDAPALEA
jgi:hypothetical protein